MIWPRGPKCPIVFCDYVGVEETMLGRSKSNPQEAGKVVSTLYNNYYDHYHGLIIFLKDFPTRKGVAL